MAAPCAVWLTGAFSTQYSVPLGPRSGSATGCPSRRLLPGTSVAPAGNRCATVTRCDSRGASKGSETVLLREMAGAALVPSAWSASAWVTAACATSICATSFGAGATAAGAVGAVCPVCAAAGLRRVPVPVRRRAKLLPFTGGVAPGEVLWACRR